MRSLGLAVFVAAAMSYSEAIIGIEEMISIANEVGAPFSEKVLGELQHEALWEHRPANGSMDVIIINKSGVSFEPQLNYYDFFDPLFGPENHLYPRTSTVFRVIRPEDNLNSKMDYEGNDKYSFFWLYFDITTSHDVHIKCSDNLDYYKIVSDGNSSHSQVRIYLNEKGGGLLSLQSQPGAALVPQRKPKVSRNMFVKASKRGSSVRRI